MPMTDVNCNNYTVLFFKRQDFYKDILTYLEETRFSFFYIDWWLLVARSSVICSNQYLKTMFAYKSMGWLHQRY